MNARRHSRFLPALSLVAVFTFTFAAPVRAQTHCSPANMAQTHGACCTAHGTPSGHGLNLSGLCAGACVVTALSVPPVIPAGTPQDRGFAPVVVVSPVLQWFEATDTPPPRH
ncbi:MAG: hypothetical protein ACRER1_08465 [Gammaproteobacteria bacterium]